MKHESCIQCDKRAVYNYFPRMKPMFCTEHKDEYMVNVRSNICSHSECPTRAVYNYPGIKIGILCKKHCKDGMINVCSTYQNKKQNKRIL